MLIAASSGNHNKWRSNSLTPNRFRLKQMWFPTKKAFPICLVENSGNLSLDTKFSKFNSSRTRHHTNSLKTKRFIAMSYTTAFRTHRWHFIKCKSNITEMSKLKTHAPSTNPKKNNKNHHSQWQGWVLITVEFVLFSNWNKIIKQDAVNLVAKTTLTTNLTRASPFLVLFSRTWETPDVHTNTTRFGRLSWSACKFHRYNEGIARQNAVKVGRRKIWALQCTYLILYSVSSYTSLDLVH